MIPVKMRQQEGTLLGVEITWDDIVFHIIRDLHIRFPDFYIHGAAVHHQDISLQASQYGTFSKFQVVHFQPIQHAHFLILWNFTKPAW